jgi:hypothetical protein
MYEVTVPSPGPWSLEEVPVTTQDGAPGLHRRTQASLYTVYKTLPITYDPVHTTPDGSFYTIDGLALSSPGRPIQPKTSVVLDDVPNMAPHGVLLIGGQSTLEAGFDPLIAHPVPTSTVNLTEPEFSTRGWFPPKMFAINRTGASVSESDRLVVVPAQFKGNRNTGLERRFTELDFAVIYADNADWTPPAIWKAKSLASTETTTFQVSAGDASGIERVLVTYADAASDTDGNTWQSVDLAYSAYTDQWEGSMSNGTEKALFFVQVMDSAGNVTISGNKGQYFVPEQSTVYLPIVLSNASAH